MMAYKDFIAEIPGAAEITQNVAELRKQKDKLIHELGFLRGTVGNEDQQKGNNSYSGHTLSQFALWAGRLLVLGVNRCFDRTPPLLISTLEGIHRLHEDILKQRKKTYPEWTDEQLGILDLRERIEKSLEEARSVHASPSFAELRVFRTEELAHSLDGVSRDREKFGFSGEVARPSFRIVMEIAEQTILLIDCIISYWEFHIENSKEQLEICTDYARTFWRALPQFSDVEDFSSFPNVW